MQGEWLLIECIHDEPTVLAVGRKPARLQPLHKVLRGSTLKIARRLTAQVRRSGHAWEETARERDEHLIAEPVRNLAGSIHGVRVWIGPVDAAVPPPPRSGAFDWNLEAMTALLTDEVYDMHAVDPRERRAEITRMQAMRWLVFATDENIALALASEADEDTVHQDTWMIRRDDGVHRNVHFGTRGATVDGGRFMHGLMIDVSPGRDEPAPCPPLTFAQAALEAELSVPGIYHVVADLHTLTAHRWLGTPMPGIAWELSDDPARNPGLHPDDLPKARALADSLHDGPGSAIVRLRNIDGGWTVVYIEAKLVLLTREPESFGALISVSEATANP